MRPRGMSLLLLFILWSTEGKKCKEKQFQTADRYVSEGAVAFEGGRLEDAESCFLLAFKAQPNHPHAASVALTNLAMVRSMLSDLDGAQWAYQTAVSVAPRDDETYFLWGKALCEQGLTSDCKDKLLKTVSINPKHSRAHLTLGIEEQKQGNFEDALDHYNHAVKAEPDNVPARMQQAFALSILKRCRKALAKTAEIKDNLPLTGDQVGALSSIYENCQDYAGLRNTLLMAVQRSPNGSSVLGNDRRLHKHRLGATLLLQQRFQQALAYLEDARSLEQAAGGRYSASILSLMGFTLTQLGGRYFNEALQLYDQAVRLFGVMTDSGRKGVIHPDAAKDESGGALSNLIRLKHLTANWTNVDQHLSALDDMISNAFLRNHQSPSNPVFILAYEVSDLTVTKVAISFGRWNLEKAHQTSKDQTIQEAPALAQWHKSSTSAKRNLRLRIGFMSSAYNDNGVGQHLQTWTFWKLCAASEHIECTILSCGESAVSVPPLSTLKQIVGGKNIIVVNSNNDKKDLAAIRDASLHVILDMNGYTDGERPVLINSFERPAPVSMGFYGYEGTYGNTHALGYILTDYGTAVPEFAGRVPTPENLENDGMYSEKLFLMPPCKFPNGDLVDSEQMSPEGLESLYTEFETEVLSDIPRHNRRNTFVFCNFAKYFKISPSMFDIWLGILKEVPDSILWILGYRKDGARQAIKHLKDRAEAAGVNASRIVATQLLYRTRHIQLKSFAHLLLDTTPYNGHLTVAESLWAGIPVLTLPQARLSSRVSHSMIKAIGLDRWLSVRSLQDYRDVAVRIARQWVHRQSMRRPIVYDIVRGEVERCRNMKLGFFNSRSWTSSFSAGMRISWELKVQSAENLGSDGAERRWHVVLPAYRLENGPA